MAESATITELKATKLQTEIDLGRAQIEKVKADHRISLIQAEVHETEMSLERADNVYARTMNFVGAINEEAGMQLANVLTKWSRISADPITLTLNSPGGDVFAGLALIDTIEALPCPVDIVVRGMGASMGGIVLQSARRRIVGKNSYVLIHEISSAISGRHSEMSDSMAFNAKLQERCLGLLAGRSNMSTEEIANRWEKKDWWLSADECLDLGFCDEIG